MIVDVHAHVVVPEITRARDPADDWRPAVIREDGGQVVDFGGTRIRAAVGEFVDVDRMIEESTECGVERLVLSPWVNLLGYDLPPAEASDRCRIQNEALARIVASHPDRVAAVGAVPLQDPDRAARDVAELMTAGSLAGVEVAASVGGSFLGDDRFLPFWEAAEGTGAVVFVHPATRGFGLPALEDYYLWNTVGNPLETAVTAAHVVMAGVLERHPRLRIVLAHGGGAVPSVRGRLRHAWGFQPQARSRLERSPEESLRLFHYDTVTHDPGLLADLVRYVGVDHVLLGSDRPFDMGTARPVEEVRDLGLSPDEEALILGANAAALVGWR